jgi:hypothetical protein
MTLRAALLAPLRLLSFLIVMLPLLLIMAGLGRVLEHTPAILRRLFGVALLAETRTESTTEINAPRWRVTQLLYGLENCHRDVQHALEHATEFDLAPVMVRELQEELHELDARLVGSYVPLLKWDDASWRTRILGLMQGVPGVLEVDEDIESRSRDWNRVIVQHQAHFRGLAVSLFGTALARDTQYGAEQALLALKAQAEQTPS